MLENLTHPEMPYSWLLGTISEMCAVYADYLMQLRPLYYTGRLSSTTRPSTEITGQSFPMMKK